MYATAAAKSLQSCPTLCDPINGSPPGSRPWDSLGKNTRVGCHFLLQCMKVKSESEVVQSCPTLRDPMDCSLPGSSIHGISQARVLEWVAIAFSINWAKLQYRNTRTVYTSSHYSATLRVTKLPAPLLFCQSVYFTLGNLQPTRIMPFIKLLCPPLTLCSLYLQNIAGQS